MSGSKPFFNIGLNNNNSILNFIRRIQLIKFIIDICFKCCKIFFINLYNNFIDCIFEYLWNINLWYNFLEFYLSIPLTIGFSTVYYSFLNYYIVLYYCKLRIININKNLINMSDKKYYFNVNELIIEHNMCCNQLKAFNKFWSKYYFSVLYSLLHRIVVGN